MKLKPILNKKAQMQQFNIFIFMIAALVAVVMFGGMIWTMGQIYNIMHNVGLQNEVNSGNPGYTNMTLAADITFGQVNNSIQALHMVAIAYILGLAVVIMVSNALVRVHPLWFFAYMLICLLAVIFAPPISNAYATLLDSGIYDGGLLGFTTANFLLLNLPTITLVISVLGGIFLFINLIRTQNDLSFGGGGI